MHEIEIYVAVDADGSYVVHVDRDELAEKFTEDVGGVPTRILAIKLSVDCSETTLEAIVPADSRKATLTVK